MLGTKHRARALEAKGQPLGRVGIIIVAGFIGLVFATTLIGVQAATSDSLLEINSRNNRLTASSDLDEGGDWNWFNVATSDDLSPRFNNSRVLAAECETISLNQLDETIDNRPSLETGPSSTADLNSESLGDLYCFAYDLEGDAIYYGGYIVQSSDLQP